ncbi:hypothetical protein M0655_23475 (plasmid) [Gordonia amicalis]|uniref:hypothetical protein n=1 Tax=Gordonia amicalis TaxID=89053 RepID=UPI00200A6649|nr:hypothetical protein [Gordonia amicalis]UPW16384.1 hypothetical protein M0655_23475 [Gordonia amicalis]
MLTWNDGYDESPPLRLRSLPSYLESTFGGRVTVEWPSDISDLLARVESADRAAERAQNHAQAVRREVAHSLLDTEVAESFGDVAAILGVSRQRIHQLLSTRPPPSAGVPGAQNSGTTGGDAATTGHR